MRAQLLEQDPLLASVSAGEVNDKLQQRRRGVVGKLFTTVVRGIWGKGIVDSVDAVYATHDVLADKDRAARQQAERAPQDFFKADVPADPAMIIDGTSATEQPRPPRIVNGVLQAPSVRPEPQPPVQPRGNEFFRA